MYWRLKGMENEPNKPNNKVILFGEDTLIGKALAYTLKQENMEVYLPSENLDVFNLSSVEDFINEINPKYVINAVSYELIRDAEKFPERAFKFNKLFPHRLARLLKEKEIFLINYSTDFIFDGKKESPYTVEDKPNPKSVYGKSKLEGEKAILDSGIPNYLIIRTSLLFGPWKHNFVENILKLIKNNKKLFITNDKIASPTYTLDLAKYSLMLIRKEAKGIFHICNSGQASWCELANQTAKMIGSKCIIEPIKSNEKDLYLFPSYSVLDTSKFYQLTHIKPRSWIQALQEYLFAFHSSEFEE